MKGQILDFTIQSSEGIISADDGNRYTFAFAEWKEQELPQRGMPVDFTLNEQGQAVAVYKLLTASQANATDYIQNPTTSPLVRPATVAVTQNDTPSNLSLWGYAIKAFTSKYSTFKGRARRKEFWGFTLFTALFFSLLHLILLAGESFSSEFGVFIWIATLIMNLIFIIPSLAVTTRRLHDTGRSGWWQLINLIPFGGIVLLIFLCSDSHKEANQYGGNPKANT
ncbi:MAG: DUF805 domain-containing protein [Acinetobacter sp.]|nr:DUF805 domain-containing protein [Acinetobacter sp.]